MHQLPWNSDLCRWLRKHHVHFYDMSKDCADGVVVAKILRDSYPMLFIGDFYIYVRSRIWRLSLENWTHLNQTVLKKLGLQKNLVKLYRYCQGDRYELQRLLTQLMKLEKAIRRHH